MKKFLSIFLLVFAATFASAQSGTVTHFRTNSAAPSACTSAIGGFYWDTTLHRLRGCVADNVFDSLVFLNNLGVGSNGNLLYNNNGALGAFSTTMSGNDIGFPGAISAGSSGTGGYITLPGSASGSLTLQPSAAASGTLTFPSATDTVALLSLAQTFSNKTFSLPIISDYTVATLPDPTANNKEIAIVTDGTTTADCTTGGGSSIAMCRSNGTAWAALTSASSGGGSSAPAPTILTLPYQYPSYQDSTSWVNDVADKIWVVRVYVPADMTVTKAGVMVAAAGTTSCDVGLYDTSGNKVLALGGVSNTTTGAKFNTTLNVSLAAGNYFEAYTCGDITASISAANIPSTNIAILQNSQTPMYGSVSTTATSGVLPATISTTVSTGTYKNFPVIVLE